MPGRNERWFVEAILKAKRTNIRNKFTLENSESLNIATEILPLSPAWVYLVKWAGFSNDENSWEPTTNLEACELLICRFWQAVGHELFFTNAPDFVVKAPEPWIREEMLSFAKSTPIEEVEKQNRNPARKTTPLSPRTPIPSAPTTPRTQSPRKVSFAQFANVSFVPLISDVENTAQWKSATTVVVRDSDDSDDDANFTPRSGIKIRIPPLCPSAKAVPASTPRLPPQINDVSAPPSDMPPEPPQESPNPLFSPPPSPSPPRSRGIKIYERGISSGSRLATKQRLATGPLTGAKHIPRASPDPPSAQPSGATAADAMDVDEGPTLIPNNPPAPADTSPADDISPMLASMAPYGEDNDEPAGGASFFGPGDDLRELWAANVQTQPSDSPQNGDSMDFEFGGLGGGVDAGKVSMDEVLGFLNTVPQYSKPPTDYRPKQSTGIFGPAPLKPRSLTRRLTLTVADRVETVCDEVRVTEVTEAAPPRIASFVPSTRDLNFARFHVMHDLEMVLPCCARTPHQFAQLTAEGSGGGAESFNILAKYMARKELVVVQSAEWGDDNMLFGYLIFLPPTATALTGYLGVPRDLLQPNCLIAVLLPFPPDASSPTLHRRRQFPRFERMKSAVLSDAEWRNSLRLEPDYQLGLRIVRLPNDLQKRVRLHQCIVWSEFERRDGWDLDTDTKHLITVLSKSQVGVALARDLPPDRSAQVIFVHVAALGSIHNLPHLAQRRLRPEMWFYLYGTHPKVPRGHWGVRPIYVLGGIVTFTPNALLLDPWGVLKALNQGHTHPLWVCYLLPQVIGLALRLNECREDETMQPYAELLPVALDRIFDAIDAGKVVLVCSSATDTSSTDPKQWMYERAIFKPLTKIATVEYCTKAFDAVFGSWPQDQWGAIARNDLLVEMRGMQVHSAIINFYRRFVVLDANPDSTHHGEDGVEWTSVGDFQFDDDFVKAQELTQDTIFD
ncbi:hypothetical protein B0H15DRAFT_927978 [Mycena belliarum]|uniref:Chromo domain-containing protein n=1 Tax=Mycena belliarum TaxID=1033014 RepID=A0AAD6UDE6_9AGAR|nr:hypothetical protein B0H15DRAFT_927978 [Mycena belliae]